MENLGEVFRQAAELYRVGDVEQAQKWVNQYHSRRGYKEEDTAPRRENQLRNVRNINIDWVCLLVIMVYFLV